MANVCRSISSGRSCSLIACLFSKFCIKHAGSPFPLHATCNMVAIWFQHRPPLQLYLKLMKGQSWDSEAFMHPLSVPDPAGSQVLKIISTSGPLSTRKTGRPWGVSREGQQSYQGSRAQILWGEAVGTGMLQPGGGSGNTLLLSATVWKELAARWGLFSSPRQKW